MIRRLDQPPLKFGKTEMTMVKTKASWKLFENEIGATSIEYALMASAIAAVIVVVVFALGLAVNGLFSSVNIP